MQIHILIDSPFYTDRIIDKMSRFSPEPKLFVIIKSHQEVKILDSEKEISMKLKELSAWLMKKNARRVYIHFLSNSIAYVLLKAQLIEKPCYWIMWGADFYGLPAFSDNYYLPLSKPFAWKNNSWKQKFAQFLGMPSSKSVMTALKKIQYFVGYEEEYKLTQKALNHEMKFVPWEYYFSIEELNMPEIDQGSGTILLGNSDDPMNNHLDVLDKLENIITKGQKIIVPVAGASSIYLKNLKAAQVASKAEIILQENLLDSNSFFKMMEEVSFVVYGHLRQQGVGTILPLLFAGKKAFLWNRNPLKGTLERWGLDINSIDTISNRDLQKLSSETANQNRKAITKVLSKEADAKRWERILNS